MECSYREEIITYAGAREAARPELTEHLKECADCRAEWDRMAAVWESLGELPSIEPKPSFLDRVRDKMHQGAWWKVLVPIGVAAAALIAVLFSLPGGDEPEPKKDAPIVRTETLSEEDREILEDLDLLENMELLQTMEAAGDLFASGEDE